MDSIDTFMYTNLMNNFYKRRSSLEKDMTMNNNVAEQKKMQKEIAKLNSLLNNMSDFKLNFLDPLVVKEVKAPKEQKKQQKESISYGISGMINK